MQIYLNSFNQQRTTNNYSRQVKFGTNKQVQQIFKEEFKGISTVLYLQRHGALVPREIALTYPSYFKFGDDEYRKMVCFEDDDEVYVTYKWENPAPRFGYGGF